MKLKTKVIGVRFLKAFVAGAVSVATSVTITNISTWTELGTTLGAIALSIVVGGITGVLLGADKWARWEE